MITDRHLDDLKAKGYTVVNDVLTSEECDAAIGQYREWLSQFKTGNWPRSFNSLITKYGVGHMTPTWEVRLKAKPVFAQIWKTDKLLSSFDAIAIGRPPEDGKEAFYAPGQSWLHLDQSPSRDGLHAYQGAIYLEETAADDWTMEVMERSHLHFKTFFENNSEARELAEEEGYYQLMPWEVKQLKEQAYHIKRVPCPKGGIILWDSRLVHANANPVQGRNNPDRWRYCVFVSMTPAIWANENDLERKRKAYESTIMTSHWSSQGIHHFQPYQDDKNPEVKCQTEVPDVAKSDEAKRLAGVLSYDFRDGNPTGAELAPKWVSEEARNRQPE